MTTEIAWQEVFQEAKEYLQKLLQFNTTNPPGNETPAVQYLAEILEKEAIECQVLESAPLRGNLVARLKGDGSKKPFLLAAHVDVVGVEEKHWKYPPFSGQEAEGCIWGRGAVDMKTMVIYELMTMLLFKRNKIKPARDLILVIVADEEVGGECGMKWMAENHPDLIRAEYSFNEVGGFSVEAGKNRLYPIQVAQKGALWLKITVKGTPGHGSMPHSDNPVIKLNLALSRLLKGFPMKATPLARGFISNLGRASGLVPRLILSLLTWPFLGERILKILPAAKRPFLSALLRNTITPTELSASQKANVIPSEASVTIDCRSLPGTDHERLKEEILKKIGFPVEVEILHDLGPYEVKNWDTPIYRAIEKTIQKHDSAAVVTPSLTVGFTDAKHLEPLGVGTYGFFPMKLPEGFEFSKLFHGHDERIPVESFQWGLQVFFETVEEVVR